MEVDSFPRVLWVLISEFCSYLKRSIEVREETLTLVGV